MIRKYGLLAIITLGFAALTTAVTLHYLRLAPSLVDSVVPHPERDKLVLEVSHPDLPMTINQESSLYRDLAFGFEGILKEKNVNQGLREVLRWFFSRF